MIHVWDTVKIRLLTGFRRPNGQANAVDLHVRTEDAEKQWDRHPACPVNENKTPTRQAGSLSHYREIIEAGRA